MPKPEWEKHSMKSSVCLRTAMKLIPIGLPILLAVHSVCQTSDRSKPRDPLDRESAQSSVYSFLQACHAHDYDKATKYLDLLKLAPEEKLKKGPQLAQELQQILDRDAQFDVANLSPEPEGSRASNLPPNRERVDSFTVNRRTIDLELERVRLRSGIYVWLFSS